MTRLACAGLAIVLLMSNQSFSFSGSAGTEEVGANDIIRVAGQVVDPEGQPVEARVRVVDVFGDAVSEANSNAESGSFELEFDPTRIARPLGRDWRDAVLVATADGFGPAWIRAGELLRDPNPKLQLARDDVSIRAQVVDSDGRPVDAAEIRVFSITRPDFGNLDEYLKDMRDEPTIRRYEREHMIFLPVEAVPWTVVNGSRGQRPDREGGMEEVFLTDNEGRLELRGVGVERTVQMEVRSPRIASTLFYVVTREQIEAKWKATTLSRSARIELEAGGSLPTIYGAKFTHVASPSRPITGTVVDHATGAPLANVGISAQMKGQNGFGYARTDEQGRYEVQGLPTRGTVSLYAVCPPGLPYLEAERERLEFSAAAPLTNTDFRLVKGVVIRGRLLDADGKPVRGRVEYLALTSNEHAQNMPDPFGPYGDFITDEVDGQFEVEGLPGQGLLVAKTYDDRFLRATLDDVDVPKDRRGYISTVNMGLVRPEHYDLVQVVSVSGDAETLTMDLRLRSGGEIPGTLVDTKGQPVHGVAARGITPDGYRERLETNRFVVSGLRPGEQRNLMFRHEQQRLGALVEITSGSTTELSVTMRPYATLTGCIVDAEGRPVPRANFALMSPGTQEYLAKRMDGAERPFEFAEGMTDADGRFRISDAISNVPCELLIAEADARTRGIMPRLVATLTLRSGETRDLGDVELRPVE